MSSSLLSVLGQPGRSFDWLTAPDALMSSTALSSSDLGVLGPILSTVESGLDMTSTDSGTTGLLGPVVDTANDAVLGVHASLEDTGHQVVPLNGPIHALTNLGETIGLGKIGEPDHLLTDLTQLPSAILDGGGLASAAPALNDVGSVLGATDGLIGSVTGAVTGSNLLAADGLLAPASAIVNGTGTGLQQSLDGIGQSVPALGDTLHDLNVLTSSIGLGGQLGTPGNLLTDVVALPGNLLSGHGFDALSPLVSDLGSVTGAATGLLGDVLHVPTSLVGDLTGGGGILTPVTSLLGGLAGGDSGSGLGGLLGGVTGEGGLLSPVTSILDGVTGGGDGSAGGLFSPVTSILGGLTGGDGSSGGGLLAPVTSILDGVTGGDHGSPVGGILAPVTSILDGVTGGRDGSSGGLLSPVTSILDGVTGGDHGSPIGGILAPVTSILDGVTGGGGDGSSGGLLSPVTSILDGATGGGDGTSGRLLSPVTSILDGVTGGDHGSPVGGILAPVTSILDGVTGGGDGSSGSGLLSPVTSLLGGLTGGSTDGTHPLIDISAGPTNATPIANVSVLTPPSDSSHAIQIGAIGVGADQPSLVNASLLNSDSLPLPTGSVGADSLVGQALDLVHSVTSGPTSTDTSQHAGLDLGLASIDLGGHVDTHHADPTPHSSTSGLHLLGL